MRNDEDEDDNLIVPMEPTLVHWKVLKGELK